MKRQHHPILICLSAVFLSCSDGLAYKPRVYQKNTAVKAQSVKSTASASAPAASPNQKNRAVYETNNWLVREEIDEVEKVNDALKVFQSRKVPVYNRKVWIYNKIIDKNDVFMDFITNDFNKDITFSPNEDFVYYIAYTPEGQSNLYGLNLTTEKSFLINPAQEFSLQTCKGKNNFVVVSEKIGDHTYNSYHIFNLEGQKVNFIEKINKIEDLENVVCY